MNQLGAVWINWNVAHRLFLRNQFHVTDYSQTNNDYWLCRRSRKKVVLATIESFFQFPLLCRIKFVFQFPLFICKLLTNEKQMNAAPVLTIHLCLCICLVQHRLCAVPDQTDVLTKCETNFQKIMRFVVCWFLVFLNKNNIYKKDCISYLT